MESSIFSVMLSNEIQKIASAIENDGYNSNRMPSLFAVMFDAELENLADQFINNNN